ncbi:MAG: biotin/lipoyl-binding protein, partial [Bacteroidota bacterium]
MLNISPNSITDSVKLSDFRSYIQLRRKHVRHLSLRLLGLLSIVALLVLFLPWIQNINAKGYVTTRLPGQRPQAIQAVIAGRIEAWYVQEGDYVEAGDTIVHISEVKSEYFDPGLLERTSEQLTAKQQSIASYDLKIAALRDQYKALRDARQLKRQQIQNKIAQVRNKVNIDSLDLIAAQTNLDIAQNQLDRTQQLYDKGLKTLTELQEKKNKMQGSRAKVNAQQNKLLNQRNELVNMQIELSSVEREYADKLAKSQSEQQSAVSAKLESVASTAKLQN